MNAAQALREARRRWGKTAHVREDAGGSSPVARAKARDEVAALRAIPQAERGPGHGKRLSDATGRALYHRCAVGRIELDLFFAVKGWGDNFAECFEMADMRARADLRSA